MASKAIAINKAIIVAAGSLLAGNMCVTAQSLHVGAPELVYSYSGSGSENPTIPLKNLKTVNPAYGSIAMGPGDFFIDAPLLTLRTGSNALRLYNASYRGIDMYQGDINNPLKSVGFNNTRLNIWKNNNCSKTSVTSFSESASNVSIFGLIHDSPGVSMPVEITAPSSTYARWRTDQWIANVYQVTSRDCDNLKVYRDNKNAPVQTTIKPGDLLGFVHLETTMEGNTQTVSSVTGLYNDYDNPGPNRSFALTNTDNFYKCCRYRIGVGFSRDTGRTWTYCGDIIKTRSTFGPIWSDNSVTQPGVGLMNIEGIPYVVKNDSFYVYFCEQDFSNYPASAAKGESVARANVSEVLFAAANISLTPTTADTNSLKTFNKTYNGVAINFNGQPFKKFDGTSFSLNGDNSGKAGFLLIQNYGQPPYEGLDFHADAAYCKPLKKYLLTVNTRSYNAASGIYNKLLLYVSDDGINWNKSPSIIIDDGQKDGSGQGAWEKGQSFFVTMDPSDPADCHEVSKEFYLFWERKSPDTGTYPAFSQSLMRVKITVPAMTPIRMMLRDAAQD